MVKQLAWWPLEEIKSTQATIYPKGLTGLLEQGWETINRPLKIVM